MTTAAIAKILKDELGNLELDRAAKRLIVPRAHESLWTDEALDKAFDDVRQLARQCAGLCDALPDNAELYASQFADGVRKAAERIQAAIEPRP